MRFAALLFLAVLTGALVCAQAVLPGLSLQPLLPHPELSTQGPRAHEDQKGASAPGSANPSHEGSAASNENAGSSGLAQRAPKPSRKQRSSLVGSILQESKNGIANVTEELGGLVSDLTKDLKDEGPVRISSPTSETWNCDSPCH
ncbi:dermcidin [Lemur catta]|uniref:dermcidin n=1 Tax=Lemur catta TaxID=9447 RepID=UPI001E26884C|nr:dermcidin [Lemur catta]